MAGVETWSRSIMWLLFAFALFAAGQMLYLGLHKWIPEGLCKLAESFELLGTITILQFDFAEIKGSFTAVVGLCIGAYVFLTKGVKNPLNVIFGDDNSLKDNSPR